MQADTKKQLRLLDDLLLEVSLLRPVLSTPASSTALVLVGKTSAAESKGGAAHHVKLSSCLAQVDATCRELGQSSAAALADVHPSLRSHRHVTADLPLQLSRRTARCSVRSVQAHLGVLNERARVAHEGPIALPADLISQHSDALAQFRHAQCSRTAEDSSLDYLIMLPFQLLELHSAAAYRTY